jgi:hypothetical protein
MADTGASWSSLFPQWLGGTAGLPAGYGPQAASAEEALGLPQSDLMSGNTGAASGGNVAGALKQAAGQLQQQQQPRYMQLGNPQQAPIGRPGGGGQDIAQLLQMLNARSNMYLGATNPQNAQPQAQPRTAGLLGI